MRDSRKELPLGEFVEMAQEATVNLAKVQHQRKGFKETQTGIDMELDVQAILDSIPFYVMLLDSDHKILLVNKATRTDLGVDPEQILGKYCPKVIHGLNEPYPGCPLEEAIEKGHSIEREIFDPEAGRWVSSSIYHTGQRTQEGREIFIHFISDINERKKAEGGKLSLYQLSG